MSGLAGVVLWRCDHASRSTGNYDVCAGVATGSALDRRLLARLFDGLGLARPAVADADMPAATSDETSRQHEQEMRKPSQEHVPWHLIKFPTPRPDQITPVPDAPAQQ